MVLAFPHPLPPTSCFCLCRFGTCYGPITCLDLCRVFTVCILTVSKLQFRQREARLRTHGLWLGFRWCSAFSHPLPPTSCFCLCGFGCLYTCYRPLTCLDLCSVYTLCILTVSKMQFRQREARLRTHGFWVGFRWCWPFRIRCHRPHVFFCAGSVLATVQLPVLTCVVCLLCVF